jgi:magnesium chelatase family protein
MLVYAHGFAIRQGTAEHVHVELDVRAGLPCFAVIGLAGSAARDARERVQAAVLNSGFTFPRRRLTANLTPAVASGGGPAFDLALACCVLAAQEQVDALRLARVGLFAELGLGGDPRPCASAAVAAQVARAAGLDAMIVAPANLGEARAAGPPSVLGGRHLRDVAALLSSRADRGARASECPPRAAS